MTRSSLRRGAPGWALAACIAPAGASVITLDFEGLGDRDPIGGFYNGGVSGSGASGPDYGVSFSPNALGLVDSDDHPGGTGNIAFEPSGSTVLFFLDGSQTFMNVEAGFENGFSFFYSSVTQAGSVTIYSGLDGTGDVLAQITLSPLGTGPGDPSGEFSIWAAVGVEFEGVARSIAFGGVANRIVFDNVTLGASTPVGVVPLPPGGLAGAGLLGVMAAGGRRR